MMDGTHRALQLLLLLSGIYHRPQWLLNLPSLPQFCDNMLFYFIAER